MTDSNRAKTAFVEEVFMRCQECGEPIAWTAPDRKVRAKGLVMAYDPAHGCRALCVRCGEANRD